jgi:hypothetical protein
MIFALVLILAILVATAVIGHQLEKAPEGFEDSRGFHFITRAETSVPITGIRSVPSVNLVGQEKRPAASFL